MKVMISTIRPGPENNGSHWLSLNQMPALQTTALPTAVACLRRCAPPLADRALGIA